MNRKVNSTFIKLIFLISINIILLNKVGNLYLKKFNVFISENNKLMLKKEINKIIQYNSVSLNEDLYFVNFNNENDIVSVDLNIKEVNNFLSSYISLVEKSISRSSFKYLNQTYKHLKTNKHTYYLVPLGMISDNPFLYNSGPSVLIIYDYINIATLKLDVSVKNYGINNALIQTYLLVHIDQSISKPILHNSSSYDYRFLLSSKIINGKVSNYLGTSLNVESGVIKSS